MEQENIIQLEDLPSLRAELFDKISHAEELGVFTLKEVRNWEDGANACEEPEHLENLIEIIDSFIDSGLDVMQRIEDLANHEFVNSEEGYRLINEAETSDYHDKIKIIEELNTLIKTVEKQKKGLMEILADKNLPQTEKNQLITEFCNATIHNKEAVLNKARLIQNPKKNTRNLEKQAERIQIIEMAKIQEARTEALKAA